MTMLVPILAGIGALCMSNPRRRRKRRRRNPAASRLNLKPHSRRITKKQYYALGGMADSTLWRKADKRGVWSYFQVVRQFNPRRRNPPYHAHVGPVYMRNGRRNPLTYGTFQTLKGALDMAKRGAELSKVWVYVAMNRNRTYAPHYHNAAKHMRAESIRAVISPSGEVTTGYSAKRLFADHFNLSGYGRNPRRKSRR